VEQPGRCPADGLTVKFLNPIGEDEIRTPLHPDARHRHGTYVISAGHTDSIGRRYEIHYCHCGAVFKFVPLGPRVDSALQ
jgi:hypothetical protein